MKIIQPKYIPLVIAAILFISSCKPYESITVEKPEKITVNSANLSEMNLTVRLPISNPNFYPVKVKKIYATAYINQNAVGKVTSSETIEIPANSDRTHNLELDVDYSDVFDSGFSLTKILQAKSLKLNLKGNLVVKSFLMKKEVNFNRSKAIDINP
jgi:LEA14-like dessication related protein